MSLARCCPPARLGHPRPSAPLLRLARPSYGALSSIPPHPQHNLGQTRLNSYLSLSRGPVSNLGRNTPSSRQPAFTPLRTSLTPPSPTIYPASRKLATMGDKLDPANVKQHHADSPPTVVRLEIEKHFEPLSDKQKRYAHYISKASFAGTRIVLRQISPESEAIYDFILALHAACGGNWPSLAEKAGISEQELTYFLEYAAMFLGNAGNYKSFGDSKFIPRCPPSTFDALATTCPKAGEHYKATNGAIHKEDDQGLMHLGYTDEGNMTTYYPDSPGITKAEIDAISQWSEKKGLLPENNRLRKTKDGIFQILIASAIAPPEGGDIGKATEFAIEDGPLQGKTVKLVYGDYSQEMKTIAGYMRKAAENADNDNQREMHLAYAKSFEEGSLLAFKDSQRAWIRDKGPMVECNIGFIETYRDPAGVRGEWEGFAAVVNLERTRAFGELVAAAPTLIPILPWSQDFEKDSFLSPDFTSLEVLTFAGSGIPAGINIPNYDDIRQSEGFKNVSLGNVLGAKATNDKIPFISEADRPIYEKHRDAAFEIQVGLHELTGHGCGKLLQETSPGVFNFDKENPPISPLTGKPVTSWYKPGQTWGSVFGGIAGSYEECRAELVAMYLSCEFPALKIFGFGDGTVDMDGEAGDVLYASYLTMARAGLNSLATYDPIKRKWGQAHSQARFSILQCFLQAGDDFCKLDYKADDLSDLTIKMDRSKILTSGREAVKKYLQKLHVYKATADYEAASKFYTDMTTPEIDFWGTRVRKVVVDNIEPRKVFVQANTTVDEATGKVSLKHYDDSLAGMIESWAERRL